MGEQTTHICNNCGAVSKGYFCPECGQRLSVHKVTFKETFEDFTDAAFSVNGPLLTTLKGLLKQPGLLFHEFLGGKRKKYYKPVTFFLLTTVVYLFIHSLIGFDPLKDAIIQVSDDADPDKLLSQARDFMLLNIDNMLFIFVFTLAIFLKTFFNSRNTLAEFLAISFYMIGVYTLIVTLNMFFVHYGNSAIKPIEILIMGVYFIVAMTSFLNRPKFLIIIKSFVLYFMAFTSYLILSFGLSTLIIFIKLL